MSSASTIPSKRCPSPDTVVLAILGLVRASRDGNLKTYAVEPEHDQDADSSELCELCGQGDMPTGEPKRFYKPVDSEAWSQQMHPSCVSFHSQGEVGDCIDRGMSSTRIYLYTSSLGLRISPGADPVKVTW
jgi:hypothetical protein